jgi:hypothetical protein
VSGFKKFTKSLFWPFAAKEMKSSLKSIESQKFLFLMVLENDHVFLSKELRKASGVVCEGV